MISNHNEYKFLQVIGIIFLLIIAVFGQTPRDLVSGNLIQFSDNGAWCWYQDERAVIDMAAGKLVLGYDASGSGVGGSPRSGDVEAVIFDLQSGQLKRYTMREGESNIFYCDDHNAPAFLIRPDGKYITFYAAHFKDTSSYYRIYDQGIWGPEQEFDWKRQRPGGANFQTTYSNLHYLSAEGRTYNFVRGNNKSPNSMVSSNMGDSWSYGGQLTRNAGVGYNNGYYKYSDNGVDRIDFIFTEYHPRDFNTSIYHGYIKDGKSYKSDGTLVDDNILDTLNIPTPANFTQVFATNTVVNGVTMSRCWNTDVQWYTDGTIATVITARANDTNPPSNNPEHRFMYCRYNGTNWTTTYLCKAGLKLYYSEEDYTGLAAMHPGNPNIIYISTPVDPRDDNTSLGVHEIFKGVTDDNGATWTWTPITQNSVRDNMRPVVPVWDENNTALLWWRGTYNSAQNYNAAIVGLLDRGFETVSPMTYLDASLSNTTLSTGAALVITGPNANAGAAENQWHRRTGFGNGDTVFTSAELGGENAPALRTQVTVPQAGIYDVWVNFWADPGADWRIKAGLSTTGMQVFRQMACKQVQAGDHNTPLVLTGSSNTFLYQAYLGRVQITTSNTIDVFVDDEAIQTGTTGILIGNTARTCYDGISYAGLNNLPSISLSATEISFGIVSADSSKQDSILVSNPSVDTLRVSRITSTNPRFTFAPATMKIAPLADSYLHITFSPEDVSDQIGYIILTHNALGSPDTVTVSGRGSSTNVNVPLLSLSANMLNFGIVQLDSVKQNTVLVANPGADTLRISAILSTNPRFTFTPATMIVAPFGNTNLFITFAPQDTTNQTGSIVLTHNASGSPDTISVSGKGLGPDALEDDASRIPSNFALNQNYPNPFNPITTITYALPKAVYVNLKVYNLLGQGIATLVDKEMPAGTHRIIWNAQAVPSGVYFYKITAGNYLKINKMIVLK